MSQATLGSGPYRNSNLFSGYYLDERIADLDAWDCDAEAREAFEDLRDLWRAESALLDSHNEDELVDAWIAEILDVLGFGTISEATLPDGGGYVDRLLFEDDGVRRDAAERKLKNDVDGTFSRASAILEAKRWDADFERRFSEGRSYRDASHQIKYYLERTPSDLRWGILTDGKRWRLYGTKDYETQTYYEVNLPAILERGDPEAFKYFFVLFRSGAFVEHAGSSFLDDVWTESETAAQELGEDLQDNVFRALRVLGKGFVESNALAIDPDDEAARDELKEQSLVLLYRLMFVLYAESRGLIDPDDPEASDEYRENFSLEAKREEILDDVEGMDVESGAAFDEEYSRFSSSIWGRLTELFELIDDGEAALDVPPYNGGLFNRDDHAFLADNEVKDPYIAAVIYWLSTSENDDGEHVPADYADLDTRHLGSIYEGLLEHEFRIADADGVAAVAADGGQVWKPATEVTAAEAVEIVEEGGLYVVNDEGERRATGAYYTPDYVVTYIVEETVDPLVDGIDADLRERGLGPTDREYFVEFWQEVKDLTVLDPAMGSGHFLTKATGYLTEQVMEVVREQEIQSYDEQYIRREISKECIYGVDLNGMAVELAKLSMWLETLAADQPLAFLDHHLKAGNSLVGSDVTEVLSDGDGADDGGQITLTQAFARVRQDTLEHVMELMADLLAYDNETLADVKSMEELYAEIREDPLYKRLFELANVHTAAEFGVDVPEGAYERMAGAIEDADDWANIRTADWFKSAQATAAEQEFFHWELEFPEVFFNSDGEKMPEAGFDAVVGNPPYVNIVRIPDHQTEYLRSYKTAYRRFDLYVLFSELAFDLTRNGGYHSYIVPDKLLSESYGKNWRECVLDKHHLSQILDLRDRKVFPDATNSPVVFVAECGKNHDSVDIVEYTNQSFTTHTKLSISAFQRLPGRKIRIDWTQETEAVLDGINRDTIPLSRISYASWGTQPGNASRFVFEERPEEIDESELRELIKGADVYRYSVQYGGRYLWYNPNELHRPAFPELFENEKIVLKKVAGKRGLVGASDRDRYYTEDSVINLIRKADLVNADDDVLRSRGIEVVNEQRGERRSNESMSYDRDTTIYKDDLELSREAPLEALLGVINSSLIAYYYANAVSGQLNVFPEHVRTIPLAYDAEKYEEIAGHAEEISQLKEQRLRLTVEPFAYLGYADTDQSITEIGLLQPEHGEKSRLHAMSDDYSNLRVGSAVVDRESPNTVLIKAAARYKPDDADAHETDRWGYTETEHLPAFRITDLTEREADLIEHFVPVAVDEAGGFANFRETATKTNSLVDRLKAIELPDVDDVADDLENYLRTTERAAELDEKIEKTDSLIDELVYDLYGLTDAEIAIVEEAVE